MIRLLFVAFCLISAPANANIVFGAEVSFPSQIFVGEPISSEVHIYGYTGTGTPVVLWSYTEGPKFTGQLGGIITFLEPGFTVWQASVIDQDYNWALVCPCEGHASEIIFTVLPAVPEPSTWAMMLLGFVGLAWMGMRQRSAWRTSQFA